MTVQVNLAELAVDIHEYALRRAKDAEIGDGLALLVMLEACLVGFTAKGLALDDVLLLVRKKWHEPRASKETP